MRDQCGFGTQESLITANKGISLLQMVICPSSHVLKQINLFQELK